MQRVILHSLAVLLVSSTSTVAQAVPLKQSHLTTLMIAQASNPILATGTFVTTEQDHPTAGMATLLEKEGKRYLVFDGNFTTAEGPDVQVVLHRKSEVPVKLNEADYRTIAPLANTNGEQTYALPDDLNLDDFQAVSIWCRRFNVSFGYATLNSD